MNTGYRRIWLNLALLVALFWIRPAEAKNNLNQLAVDKESLSSEQESLPKQTSLENTLFEIEGALTDADIQSGDGRFYDTHVFQGQAEQIVRISLDSDAFDTFLFLQDASGKELIRNDDGSSTNAEIVFQLPATGSYRILASSYAAGAEGTYKVVVSVADTDSLHRAELKLEADQLFQQGGESYEASRYRAALDSWQTALNIYRELLDRQGEASSLGSIGSTYHELGEYPRAIEFHQKSLEISREIGNRQDEVASLSNLGRTYIILRDYQRTIELHQEQLEIAQAIGDYEGEAKAFTGMGNAYLDRGQYQQALDFYQQSLAVHEVVNNRQGESDALRNIGVVYNGLGAYPQAISVLQSSLAIRKEIGDLQSTSAVLGDLGNVHLNLGAYQQALDFYQQSLAIERSTADLSNGEMHTLLNIGNTYNSLEAYQQALDFYQQSLAIARADSVSDRKGEANALGNIGLIYQTLGEYRRAIDFSQQSLSIKREIGDRQGELKSLGNIGNTYKDIGDYSQAASFLKEALAIAREIGSRQDEAVSLTNIGLTHLNAREITLAETSLSASITIFDSLRSSELSDQNRISLFDTQTSAYKGLELALILQNKLEMALEISERGRTRSFVQLVSERSLSESKGKALIQSPSFKEIQEIAKAHQSTLVEYSLSASSSGGGSAIYIWLVQPTGQLHLKEVPINDNLSSVDELIARSRKAMNTTGRGGLASNAVLAKEEDATDELRELYQLLIEPIADLLPSDPDRQVVFIPQGDLFLVPFPALQDESGTYLIKQHTLLTAPSIQVLDITRQQAVSSRKNKASIEIITIGNPVMPEVWDTRSGDYIQLPSLPGAEKEAQAVAAFFKTEALLGAQATEKFVKQRTGSADIVHLATHGLLEYGVPEESGAQDVPGAIALTPTQNEDGLLTSAEILELDLKADLVVLSACDTGLGTITGDGVIGLSRSFIAAGVPSVVVSLWSIPDAPTADLMTEFYSQMQQGQDKAQALRQAMLTTMKSHPDPADWAAFTLIGEGD